MKGTLIIPQDVEKVTLNAEQIWFNGIGKIIPGTKEVMAGTVLETEGATFEN